GGEAQRRLVVGVTFGATEKARDLDHAAMLALIDIVPRRSALELHLVAMSAAGLALQVQLGRAVRVADVDLMLAFAAGAGNAGLDVPAHLSVLSFLESQADDVDR